MKPHLIHSHGIVALRGSHPEVRRLKRQNAYHAAHGNKVWRSSFVLMDYLMQHPIPHQVQAMDLGCGWGLSGIFLNKQFAAQVTGVDIDAGVEPFLKLQADLNQSQIQFIRQDFARITVKQLSAFHTLVGADICFWDSMSNTLFNLMRRARKAGVKQILITDPGRPPFWDLVERCSNAWGSDYETHRIEAPIQTTKYILVVKHQSDD